ncbi:MAG: hypothetical protein RLZZ227_980 [Pseudomonadota bacterium]|jgi:hypothetical protein
MTASTHSVARASSSSLPLASLAVLLSCVFSVLVILQNPLLNDDAYKYLRAAQMFNTDGAVAVLQSYGWYNYSILIALLDRIVPGDMLIAAHVLDTTFYALLTWVFMRLCGELRASYRVQAFAAVCILGFPLTNEMRYFLIRDTGFWAFSLLSVVLLIRYRNTGALRTALGWSLALCAAVVFRLEALLLLALAPLCLLTPDLLARSQRISRFLRVLGVLLATLVVIMLVTLAAGVDLIALISYAYRYYLPLLADLFPLLTNTARDASTALFTPDNHPGGDNIAVGMALVLFGDALALLGNLVYALSLPIVALMLYYRMRHSPLALTAAGSSVLVTYIGAAMLSLLLFVLIMHFLTQRYAALLSLLLLSLVPLMLDDLYATAQQRGTTRRFRYVLGFFCLYYVVDSLVSFGYSQRHLDDGIAWARDELPANTRLHTNSVVIAYHSGRIPDYDQTSRDIAGLVQASASGDYLVLDLARGDADAERLEANDQLRPVQSFANERGDEVRVYQRR